MSNWQIKAQNGVEREHHSFQNSASTLVFEDATSSSSNSEEDFEIVKCLLSTQISLTTMSRKSESSPPPSILFYFESLRNSRERSFWVKDLFRAVTKRRTAIIPVYFGSRSRDTAHERGSEGGKQAIFLTHVPNGLVTAYKAKDRLVHQLQRHHNHLPFLVCIFLLPTIIGASSNTQRV